MNVRQSRRGRFVPKVEALEHRLVPAVQIHQFAGVITVSGSSRAEQVTITDNGTNAAGAVRIVATPLARGRPTTFLSSGPVQVIHLGMNSGNDTVDYTLTAAGGANVSRLIDCAIAAGKDAFHGHVTNGLGAGANWKFHVTGATGADTASLDATGELETGALLDLSLFGAAGMDVTTVTANNLDVRSGARFNVDVANGTDRDAITMTWSGRLRSGGTLDFHAAGASGKDTIRSDFTFQTLPTEFGGRFTGRVEGGDSPDTLTMNLTGPALGSVILAKAELNGGSGADLCVSTTNVTRVSC